MAFVKKWGGALLGIFILLVLLLTVLNLLAKGPGIVGTVGQEGKKLATEGAL